jgi:hypothetical protein
MSATISAKQLAIFTQNTAFYLCIHKDYRNICFRGKIANFLQKSQHWPPYSRKHSIHHFEVCNRPKKWLVERSSFLWVGNNTFAIIYQSTIQLAADQVFLSTSRPGLPDGLFWNQKSQFGKILEGISMENLGIFYDHLVYFTAIGNI